MKTRNKSTQLLIGVSTLVAVFSIHGSAFAVDDGARAYWKGRDGTQVVSFQYLNLDMQSSGSQQFDPAHFIYPDADVNADIAIASWARFITLFDRPSSVAVSIVGGSIDADVNVTSDFLPGQGVSESQSASGYGDPSVMLNVNLFGTPPLKSTVDLLNYEPTWTMDAQVMMAAPMGSYDKNSVVNMGLNRWYGRFALPLKYHFGAFTPGYRNSIELIPSVWLFADNDDFVGQNLENDPLWQLEGHLTHDFTANFYGSLDLLYRGGFQSTIDGAQAGDSLNIGDIGFSLNYQLNDNTSIRAGYSSNVFGDSDLETSMIRIAFVYGWHPTMENAKKLQQGH
jgi:hypothetical protein